MTNEQKAAVVLERLNNSRITEAHSFDTFTTGLSKQNFSKDSVEPKRHNYDYAITDSKIKRNFSKDSVEPTRHNYDYVNTDFKN